MCQVYSSIMISQQRRPHYPFSENTFRHKSEFSGGVGDEFPHIKSKFLFDAPPCRWGASLCPFSGRGYKADDERRCLTFISLTQHSAMAKVSFFSQQKTTKLKTPDPSLRKGPSTWNRDHHCPSCIMVFLWCPTTVILCKAGCRWSNELLALPAMKAPAHIIVFLEAKS